MDIMIDIETGSTLPTAAIFSIGAVGFTPETNHIHKEISFYIEITHASNIALGRILSPETMKWWETQGLAPDGPHSLPEALQSLLAWIPRRITNIWANSPSFDLVILKDACRSCNLDWPFPYWIERDVRTLKALTMPATKLANSHNAYFDAVRQAFMVCNAYKTLNLMVKNLPNPWSSTNDHCLST
jgi:hypothetical protein